MTGNNFHQALFHSNLLYGVEMNDNEFEEVGLIAWNFIGNKQTRLYKTSSQIETPDNIVQLPCNCDIVEAVTYDFEDWDYTTSLNVNGDLNSRFAEQYIESRKTFKNPLYISGKYAKYERSGDILYFNKNYGKVNILYRGVILDEDGLPLINDKESIAIATFIAWRKKYKEGLMTNNGNIIKAAQLLQQDWLKYCDAARVPEYINQNEMNEILEAKTSWNRKIFNKSYKPYY